MTQNKSNYRWSLMIELATRDLWYDRMISLCIVAALVAVIAPLLLLFGLKQGVVMQLRDELLSDPHNLEVRMLGNHTLGKEWFSSLAAQSEVQFFVPLTRSLNTQADLVRDSQHFVENVEVIPTGNKDPLLSDRLNAPSTLNSVLLSVSAANKLNVQRGQTIRLLVMRKLDGKTERGEHEVTVDGVLEASAFVRPAILVSLDLLIAIEQFRDGFKEPLFGFESGKEALQSRDKFARARIYASSLDDVGKLADWLEDQNIESRTQLREIESVKAISRVLGLIFAVVAWAAVSGCIASLVGAFLANIDRKRKDLAYLRLLGFHRIATSVYVMVQAALLTCVAFIFGYAAYLLGSEVFNQVLGANLADKSFVCHLESRHILLAFSSALLIAIFVAGVGGLRAIQIQPSESLREI
jgi:putative ABC transport system permease protein